MADKTLSLAEGDLEEVPAPAGPALAPGALLDDRYRIVRLIAEGGMGTVYEAEAVRIGRPVAVKVLNPLFAREPLEVERFRREARIAVQVSSPHVVEMLDFGQAPGGELFLVMELLRGESLRARLDREPALPPPVVAELMRQLLRGLSAAHQAGIVHRDLKPDNLWLVPEEGRERLTILDFGIAKLAGPQGPVKTQAGLIIGTPEFLAPEQAVGGEVDHRADLYSAGIIAWVMLTGRHPFPAADTRALLRAQAFDPVPSPERELPALADHPALLRFIARATVKDRAGRAQSAQELLQVLDGREGGGRRAPRHARPLAPRPGKGRRPLTSYLAPVVSGLPVARTLTLLSSSIEGWAALEAALRPDERALRLLEHDRVVVPALRAWEGRRALVQGEALTGAFASPTNAVLCARAIQDRVAEWNERAPAGHELSLRLALHAGELPGGRVEPGRGPLAVVEAVRDRTPPGGIWLTRAVALTMNTSEAPIEPLAEAVEAAAGERLSLYRVRPAEGAAGLPYGGREAARVPREDRVSRLVAPVSEGIASLEDAGEARGRALLRVGGASARLLAVSLAEVEVLAGAGLVVVAGRVAGLGREPPWAGRALGRLRGTRRWLGQQRAL
ncbi:MAG: serine/threonine protein kinase, partial [Anaeromyxobacteraceae bacterium]|nr:serine/threonine protein kinase [Anaeromyxobacteraceae bacterium]